MSRVHGSFGYQYHSVITIPCKTIRKKKNDNPKRDKQKLIVFFCNLNWYSAQDWNIVSSRLLKTPTLTTHQPAEGIGGKVVFKKLGIKSPSQKANLDTSIVQLHHSTFNIQVYNHSKSIKNQQICWLFLR